MNQQIHIPWNILQQLEAQNFTIPKAMHWIYPSSIMNITISIFFVNVNVFNFNPFPPSG